MENKILQFTSTFKAKASDGSDDVIIEGYANTTTKDRQGDIILEEAWTKGGLNQYLKNPVILAFHDHKRPIGSMQEYSVNSNGLKIVARISKAAGDVYELVKSSVLRTFSVGFRVKDADYDQNSDLFVIKDLELFEISVVSVPANPDSTFSVRKCFASDKDYNEFREEFVDMSEKEKGDTKVDPIDVDNLIKQLEGTLDTVLAAKLDEKLTAAISKGQEDIATKISEALDAHAAKVKEEEEKTKMTDKVEITQEGVEKLLADLEAKFNSELEKKESSFTSVLDGLRTEVKEKADELEALRKSRMSFADKDPVKLSAAEVDKAIIIAKSIGRKVEDTVFGKQLIEKSGQEHWNGSANWEEEFNTRVWNDIRQQLVVEPLFRTIPMNTVSMQIPTNPDAGYGEWIAASAYGASRNTATESSTGTAVVHQLADRNLVAHKLASKEWIGYEEEEDSIVPLVPIIREALVRRMAKASDRALLLGDAGTAADSGTYPFNGIATLAADAGGIQQTPVSTAAKITVDTLSAVRRGLGVRGLNPGEVKLIVSMDAYYDLLEDPDFRTIDVVGPANATILTGTVGKVNGSDVIVSGEFEAKGAGKHAVVAVYTPNFLIGTLRNLMIERDRDVLNQQNVIVATRRMGFLDLLAGAGASVATWS